MKKSIFFISAFCISTLFVLLLNGDERIESEITGVDERGNVESLKKNEPRIALSQAEIYRYEPLTVYLENLAGFDASGSYLQAVRDGKARRSGDGLVKIPFLPDRGGTNGRLRAVYLPDFNERPGVYEIAVFKENGEPFLSGESFTVKKRPLSPMKKGLAVVDLEMNGSIRGRSFVSPDGTSKDCSALLEWIKYMDADALWVLSGETTSFRAKSLLDEPWDPGPRENLELLKALAEGYGVEIGAYTMCFYVPGDNGVPPRYDAAIGYESTTDTLYRAKHISLNSERRILDIIELSRQFQNDPGIRYIGFDFIRTGKTDGYELAEEVVRDTNARTPENWSSLTRDEKIRWFARKIEVEKDPLIIEKWRWWRAHKVAGIIKRVIEEAQITKPVWVYTLGWNHGKEHGQDPMMFFDAGVTIDAVMLYEATKEQFKNLLPQWRGYLRAGDGNMIVGNCVDEKLLDSDLLSPPDELFRRNVEGYRNIMEGGLARGIFFHDLSRAFWGRKGGYSTKDYATAFQSSVYSLRKELQVTGLVVDLVVKDSPSEESDLVTISGFIQVKNLSSTSLEKVVIELVDPRVNGGLNYFYNDRYFENGSRLDIGGLAVLESKRIDFAIAREKDFSQGVISNPGSGPREGDGSKGEGSNGYFAPGDKVRFKVEITGGKVYYITEFVNYRSS